MMQIAIEIDESAPPSEAIISARRAGFDGLCATLDLLHAASDGWLERLSRGDELRRELADAGVALAAFHAGLAIDIGQAAARGALQRVREAVERTAACGCARVIVRAGSPGRETLDRRITRTTESLVALCETAKHAGVTILLDNRESGLDSRALWLLRDGSSPEFVRFAFDPFDAGVRADSASVSLKRLAGGLDIVYLPGVHPNPPANRGPLSVIREADSAGSVIELLRGVAFRNWLCVTGVDHSQAATAANALRAELARPEIVLSAYKGDKHTPRFAARE